MITLTNSFHHTSINLGKKAGDVVDEATRKRVQRTLCPAHRECTCSGEDGTRDSDYTLMRQSTYRTGGDDWIIVDEIAEDKAARNYNLTGRYA